MHDFKYFSLVLDESKDVMDFSQLLIYTRTVDCLFEVHKELKMVPLHATTKGTDILNDINSVVTCMVAWTTRQLLLQMEQLWTVMDLVAKVTNLIRRGNRSLSHRKCIAFLNEADTAYGNLQMHTEV